MHQLTSSTLKRSSITINSDNKITNHSVASYLEKRNIKHKEPCYVEEDLKSVSPSSSPVLITSSPVTTLLPNSHALYLSSSSSSASSYSPSAANNINSIMAAISLSNSINTFSSRTPSSSSCSSEYCYASPVSPYKVYKSDKNKLLEELLAEIICNSSSYDEAAEFVSVIRVIRHEDCYLEAQRQDSELFEFFRDHFAFLIRMILGDYHVIVDRSSPRLRSAVREDDNNDNITQTVYHDAHVSNVNNDDKREIVEEALPFNDALQKEATSRAIKLLCGHTPRERMNMHQSSTPICGPVWDASMTAEVFAEHRLEIEVMCEALYTACEELEGLVAQELDSAPVMGNNNIVNSCQENNKWEKNEKDDEESLTHDVQNKNIGFISTDSNNNQSSNKANVLNAHPEHYSTEEREEKREASTINTTVKQNEEVSQFNSSTNDEFDDNDDDKFVSAQSSVHDTTMSAVKGESGKEKECNEYEHFMCHLHHVQEEEEQQEHKHHEHEKLIKEVTVQNNTRPVLSEIVKFIDSRCAIIQHILLVLESLLVCVANEHKNRTNNMLSNNTINNINSKTIKNNNEWKANSCNYHNVHSTSPSSFTPDSMSEFGILDFLSQSENLLSESRRKSMLTLQNVSSASVPFSSASQLYSPSVTNNTHNMCGIKKECNLQLREESTHTMKSKQDNITSPLLKPVSWVVQQQQQYQKERSKKMQRAEMQRQHQTSAHHHHEEKKHKSHIVPLHDRDYEYQNRWHKDEEHIKKNVKHTLLQGKEIELEKDRQDRQMDVVNLSVIRSLPLHIMTTTTTSSDNDRNEPNSVSDSKSGNECNSCKSCGSLSLPHSSCSSSNTENDTIENKREENSKQEVVGKETGNSGNGEIHDREVDFNSIASSDTLDPLHFTVHHAINTFMHVFLSITTIHQQLTQYRMAYKEHCNAWRDDAHAQECQCNWCKRFDAINTELYMRSEENLELLKRTTVALAAYDCQIAETSIAYIDGQGPAFTAQATMLLAHVLSPELLAANPTASRGGEALRWILSFVFGGCDSNDVARIQSERMQHQELLLTRRDSECCYSLQNSSDSDNETFSSSSNSRNNSYPQNSFEENEGDMTDREHKRQYEQSMKDNNNDYNKLKTTKRKVDCNNKKSRSSNNNNTIRDHDNTSPTIARLSVEYILAACFTCCHPLMTVIGCVAESDAYGCGITIARAVLQYAFTLAQTSARFLREPQLGNTWYTPFTSAMMRGLNELAHVHHSLEHSHPQQQQQQHYHHHNYNTINYQVNGKMHEKSNITDKTHTNAYITALRFTLSHSTGHYRFKPVPHAKVTGLSTADVLETARGRTTRRCLALQWAKCVVLSGRTLVRGGITEVYIPRDHYGYLNELSRRLQALLTNYVHVANAKKEQRQIDLEEELSSINSNSTNSKADSESEASLVSRRRLFSLLEITLMSAHAVPSSSSSPVQETELAYPTTSTLNSNTTTIIPSSSVISISPKTTNLHKHHSSSAIPKKSISRLWSLANTESEDESKNRQRYDAAFIDSFCLGKSAADFLLETEYVVLPVHEIIFASLYSVLTATSEVMLCEQPRLNSIFVNELITLLYEVNQGMLKPWFLPSEKSTPCVTTSSSSSSLLPPSPSSKSHSKSFTTCNKDEALMKIENDTSHKTQLEHHIVEGWSATTHVSNQVVNTKKKRRNGRSHHAWMRIGSTHHTKNKRNVRSLHALIPEAQSNIDRVLNHPCVLLHAAEYGVLLREGLQCGEVLASWDARLQRNPDDLVRGFHTLLSELWNKLEDEYVCPSYRDYVVATRTLRMLLGVSVREQGMNLHGNVLHVDDLDVKGTKKEDVALRLGVMTSQDYTVGEMDEAPTKELSEVDSEAESDDVMSRSSQDSNTSNPKYNIDDKMIKELTIENKTLPPSSKRTCQCSDTNLSSNEVNTLHDKDKHHVESLKQYEECVYEENEKKTNNHNKGKENKENERTSKCKKACQLIKTGALAPEPQFAKGQSALCLWGKPQVRRSRRYYNSSNSNTSTSPTRTSISALIHQHMITLVSTRSEIAILLARAPPTWNLPSASVCLSWPTTNTNTNTTLSEKNVKTERYNIMVESTTPTTNNTTTITDRTNKMNSKLKVNVVSVEVDKCTSGENDHDIFRITTLLHPASKKTELTNSCNNIITNINEEVNSNLISSQESNKKIEEENASHITSETRKYQEEEKEPSNNIAVENMSDDEVSKSVRDLLENNKLGGETVMQPSFPPEPCDDVLDLIKLESMSDTNSSILLTSNSPSLPINSSNTTEEHEEEEEEIVNEEEQELSSKCALLNLSSMVISPTSADSVGYSHESNTSSSIHTPIFRNAHGNAQLKVKNTSLRPGNSWSLNYPHTARMLHSAAFALHNNDKSNNSIKKNTTNINSNHSFPSAFFSSIDMSRVFPEKKIEPKKKINSINVTSSSACTRAHDNKTERINTNKLLELLSRQHDNNQLKTNNEEYNNNNVNNYSQNEHHKDIDEKKENNVMEELHGIDKAPLQISTMSFDQVIKPHSMPCSPTWWESSLSFSNPELTTSYEQFAATTHGQVDANSTSDNFLSKEVGKL